MGGRLSSPPDGAAAPSFFVEARADPGTAARPGTPLQQAQIVKLWLDRSGAPREKVFMVAGDPRNGASVDEQSCAPRGSGSSSLCAVWQDPEHEPGQAAVYYARVLENPSCRWSTRDCASLAPAQRPLACSDPSVQRVIQERAITSAISVTP